MRGYSTIFVKPATTDACRGSPCRNGMHCSDALLQHRRNLLLVGCKRWTVQHCWIVLFLAILWVETVHGQAPTVNPAVTSNPTQMPTFSQTVDNVTETVVPSVAPQTSTPTTQPPTQGPTQSPSLQPTRTFEPTNLPTVSPTSNPTVSFAPSPSPSDSPTAPPSSSFAPTDVPSVSFMPSSSQQPTTVPTMPTGQPTTVPTKIPTTAAPTVVPSTSTPTSEVRNQGQRVFLVFSGMSNGITGRGNFTREWERLTSRFVFNFWNNYYLSPFRFENLTGTNLLQEMRQPPSNLQRMLQEGNETDSPSLSPVTRPPTTSPTRSPVTRSPTASPVTRSPTMSPTMWPTPDPESPILPLYIECRIRVFFRILDQANAIEQFGDDFISQIFLLPFEQPIMYTMEMGWLTGSTEIPELTEFGLLSSTSLPTAVPTVSPTFVPTEALVVPSSLPTEAPTPDRTPDDAGDRSYIAYVVVVVVVSICVAAGYLYYLVRKEDQQPIVGGLPEDLSNRDIYVETHQSTPHSRQPSDDPPVVDLRHEENVPLNPAAVNVPGEIQEGQAPAISGGTLTTLGTSGSASNVNLAPMAVLDDVPHDSDFLVGLGDDDDDDEDDGDSGDLGDGMDLGPSQSFDSGGEGRSPLDPSPYDLSGFQMDVQNLDDV